MFRILSTNFQILQTVTKYNSIVWNKKFTESGSFTIRLPLSFNTNIDLKNKIIRHKDNYGIIQYINATSGGFEIRGYDLKILMAYRVGKGSYSGNDETIIKNLVSDNTQGVRGFSYFGIAPNQQRGQSNTYDFEKADTLENHLHQYCTTQNLGYDIDVISNTMTFDICVPSVIDYVYSERRHNILSYEYTYDETSEKNVAMSNEIQTAFYKGQAEPTGLLRKEIVINDNSEDADLSAEGEKLINDNLSSETIKANICTYSDYKTKWKLGDYVSVSIRLFNEKLIVSRQITEVEEVYEPNDIRIIPTFGQTKNTILKKLIKGRG